MDTNIKQKRNFWKGLIIAIPISLILWLIIINSVNAENLTIDKVYDKLGNEITSYNLKLYTADNLSLKTSSNLITSVSFIIVDTYQNNNGFILNNTIITATSSGGQMHIYQTIYYNDTTIINTTEATDYTSITLNYNIQNTTPKPINKILTYARNEVGTATTINTTINGYNATNTTYTQTTKTNNITNGNYCFFTNMTTYYTKYCYNQITTSITNITGLYNTILQINAYNLTNNATINTFNGWISTGIYNETYTTTNGIALLYLIQNTTYTTYTTSTNYAITTQNTKSITPNTINYYTNYTLWPDNTLIINTKDVYYNIALNNVSINITGSTNYNYLVNSSNTFLNLNSGNYNVLISKTGYTSFTDTLTISSTTLVNKTYYLSTSGTSITFYIKNIYDQYLSNVQVNISRATDQTLLYTKLTDGVGSATFTLDPNIQYLVTATSTGYNSYSNVIYPTTDTFILTLGTNITTIPDYYAGITTIFSPQTSDGITNNTNQQLGLSYTSTYWNISNCYLTIKNTSGITLNTSNFILCNPLFGLGTININTGTYTSLNLYATLTINNNGNYQNITYQQTYSISQYEEGDYSLMHAFRKAKTFTNAGFNDTNRIFLVFIIIFSIVLTAARNTINNYVNSGAVLLLLFLLTLTGCYLDLLNLGVLKGSSVGDFMAQYGICVLIGILAFTTIILNMIEER